MNKLNKVAALFAVALLSAGAAQAQNVDNWRATDGTVWKNGTNELCWRNNFWTPATGIPGCDGVPVAQAPEAPVVAPTVTKVTLNADTFFDFDKSTIKPEGRQVLDQVADTVQSIDLETLIATGHTDSIGSDAYNQALSLARAESVKAYLVSQGIPAARI